MRHLLTLFLVLFASTSAHLFAEGKVQIEKAELSRETILKKYPTLDSPAVGKLPKGTILELSGQEENSFAEAEVELSNGTVANGWIEINGIKGRESEALPKKIKPTVKTGKKLTVPKDEGVLLRREQTFYYGLGGGLNYGMLSYVEAEETSVGMSFGGEVHAGIFFNSYSRGQINLGYLRMEGKDSEGTALGFGYLNLNVEGQLLIDERFIIFASLGYLNGIGITAAASTVAIEGAGDVSTFVSQVGGGYRFPISDVSSLGVKTSYLFGFARDPIGIQGFLLSVFLDFEG